jgi:C4-dicarboxylate transporter DctM subunit
MSEVTVGALGIFAGLALVLLRVPIAVAFGLVSFFGLIHFIGPAGALGIFSAVPFDAIGNWDLTAVPTFLLMGYLCVSTGLTEGLFRAMRMFLGRLPGGLAIASVGACALFSSASGSSIATTAAMARIAVPEMLRYGYQPNLAAGVVAASGTLGSLIPPSILMILYAVYAEISVAKIFLAGVLPGILTAVIYSMMIVIRVKINPKLAGPTIEKFTWKDRLNAIRQMWPLPTIIVIVLGGIFVGFFTPTQAGAVGASASFIVAVILRRMTWEALKDALMSTVVSTASIFIIVVSTLLLTRFMALSGLPISVATFLASFMDGPIGVVLTIAILYLILGMFVDSIGLLLLTLPFIIPLANTAGLELVWLGILLIKLLEIGLMTPPVGLNVFVLKSALGDQVTLQQVFKGVGWFILVEFLILALLIAFPSISLMLPNALIT